MRITIVTAVYPPEALVAGRMASDLAAYLISIGHAVRVICPYPSRPLGTEYPQYPNRQKLMTSVENGIAVTRIPSLTAPAASLAGRIRESWSFGRWAARAIQTMASPPTVVYEAAWPILAKGMIGTRCARMGIPRITHIMDTYPESAFAKVPRWVSAVVGKPLLYLDKKSALQAAKVVVISENMRDTYEKTRGVPPLQIEVVRTWQDEAPFLSLPKREGAGRRYGIRTDVFTFLYLGNIGPVAGVDHAIASFSTAGLQDAQLLIIGQGSQREACMQLARQSQANIQFLADPEMANVPLLQSLADVCLLPVKRGAASSSIPSKLSAYMLSGKPVLASVDANSDSARLIRTADCGWVVEPEDRTALAQTMRELCSQATGTLAATGARGRGYALEHLSKKQGVKKLAAIILEAVGRKREPETALPGQVPVPAPMSSTASA